MNHTVPRLCVLGLLLVAGCGPAEIRNEDKAVLDALLSYRPEHKLDNQGQVFDLKLEGVLVDDRALVDVAKLTGLRRLSLYDTQISDAGIARLQANRERHHSP